MTYIVSSGALNSTHSLTQVRRQIVPASTSSYSKGCTHNEMKRKKTVSKLFQSCFETVSSQFRCVVRTLEGSVAEVRARPNGWLSNSIAWKNDLHHAGWWDIHCSWTQLHTHSLTPCSAHSASTCLRLL